MWRYDEVFKAGADQRMWRNDEDFKVGGDQRMWKNDDDVKAGDDEKMEFNTDEEPDLSACIPAHAVEGKSIDFTINLKLTGNSPNENMIERQISNRFVLCSQSPHVHAQFRISIEEPETTMMSTWLWWWKLWKLRIGWWRKWWQWLQWWWWW